MRVRTKDNAEARRALRSAENFVSDEDGQPGIVWGRLIGMEATNETDGVVFGGVGAGG